MPLAAVAHSINKTFQMVFLTLHFLYFKDLADCIRINVKDKSEQFCRNKANHRNQEKCDLPK